jgi:hypothetical protein
MTLNDSLLCKKLMKNKAFYAKCLNSCTTSIQQLYNNPSHEGGSQYVGLILMWEIVVQLLYWCCKSNIFLLHEGGLHTLEPTLMWRVLVHLLCWCSAWIKSHLSLGKNQLSGALLLVTMKVMVEGSFFVFCLFKYDVIFKINIEFKIDYY